MGGVTETGHLPISLYRKKRIKILLLSLIGTFRKTGEPIRHRPCFHWLAFSEKEPCPRLDMQRKSLVRVDTSQPYSRKGLGGWMTNVSTRFLRFFLPFSLYREIGLTRLTSTPLTPTGSRAEACQPLRVFCAACQGRTAPTSGQTQTARTVPFRRRVRAVVCYPGQPTLPAAQAPRYFTVCCFSRGVIDRRYLALMATRLAM